MLQPSNAQGKRILCETCANTLFCFELDYHIRTHTRSPPDTASNRFEFDALTASHLFPCSSKASLPHGTST